MNLSVWMWQHYTYSIARPKADSGSVRVIDLSNKQDSQQDSWDFLPVCNMSLFVSSILSLSFSFPLLSQMGPMGKEVVIWSLQALIKTSVWLSGISCADVWVYFSVVLWIHGNLHLLCFLFSLSLSLSPWFSGHWWSIQQRQVSC